MAEPQPEVGQDVHVKPEPAVEAPTMSLPPGLPPKPQQWSASAVNPTSQVKVAEQVKPSEEKSLPTGPRKRSRFSDIVPASNPTLLIPQEVVPPPPPPNVSPEERTSAIPTTLVKAETPEEKPIPTGPKISPEIIAPTGPRNAVKNAPMIPRKFLASRQVTDVSVAPPSVTPRAPVIPSPPPLIQTNNSPLITEETKVAPTPVAPKLPEVVLLPFQPTGAEKEYVDQRSDIMKKVRCCMSSFPFIQLTVNIRYWNFETLD